MPKEAELLIEVGPDGETKIDAIGFLGKECELHTNDIAKALGTVTKHQSKQEKFRKPNRKTHVVRH